MVKRPNIMLLMMDSVRAANLSCYGYGRVTTPNIDALAKESTLFERAISVGCWTLPVHASLFTGLYPLNHGLTVSKDALPDNFPTLAQQLKELGYQTASFSSNAYVSEATRLTQGFDTVEDIWRVSNPRGTRRTATSKLIGRLKGLGAAAKPAVRLVRALQRARLIAKQRRNRRDKGARLANKKIQAWLANTWDPNKPFFVFVNYMETHEPYNPPYPYDQRFMPKRFSPWHVARVSSHKAITAGPEKLRQDDLQILQALYDGELNYLDHQVGELVGFIQSRGFLDDTVLVITSDHGDSLGEHNHLGHRMTLYEQLVHVPLIIRYSPHFGAGAREPQMVSLIDLYPTFLELAGTDLSQTATNGFHSLAALPEMEKRPYLIAENTAPKSQEGVTSRMLRTDRYKYIWKSDQQHELYDLVQDPGELVNLIAVRPEVARQMGKQLEAWHRSLENHAIETSQIEYDEVMVERLRQLGYVE